MAGGGNAIRGSRVGAGPMGEAERGDAAPRQAVTYFCSRGHSSVVAFSIGASMQGHKWRESSSCPWLQHSGGRSGWCGSGPTK